MYHLLQIKVRILIRKLRRKKNQLASVWTEISHGAVLWARICILHHSNTVFSLVKLIMGLLRIIESTILLWLRIHIRALKPLPWKSLFVHLQTILSSCTPIFWRRSFFQKNCGSDLTHLASTYRFAFSVSTVAFEYRYMFYFIINCIPLETLFDFHKHIKLVLKQYPYCLLKVKCFFLS